MLNLNLVVDYINANLQSSTYTELVGELSQKYGADIASELQKNNYKLVVENNKKKIVRREEQRASVEEKANKMDYEKLLNFNSDSVFSVRIDGEINKKFQKFCKKNKKISKNKLVSLALDEFLNKYN